MAPLIIVLFASFVLSYLLMPSLIRVAYKFNLLDKPDARKSHEVATPTIGGIAIYFGFMVIMLMTIFIADYIELASILAALTIMLLVGLRDDLDPMEPWEKLFGQLVAISILIFISDIRITSWFGLFGIHELEYTASILTSYLVYVFLINSFNLIDGIDGLCASLTIFVLTVLGTWLAITGETSFALLSFGVAGSSLAFLRFNISPARVFMGDTGSLVLGTVCAILALHTLEINLSSSLVGYTFESGPSIIIGLFALPIFDTIRVFVLRIAHGRSPLVPDKNHIHHLLVQCGLTHMQSTAALLVVTTFFVMMALRFQNMGLMIFICLFILMGSILSLGLFSLVSSRRKVANS